MSSVTHPASSSPVSAAPAATSSQSSPPFFSSGASPPIIIGFIGIGAFALGVISLCAWRRITGRDVLHLRPLRNPNLRRWQNLAGGKPELFDVWTEGRATGDFKWEKSMPFSAAVLASPEAGHAPEPRQEASDRRRDSHGKDVEEHPHECTLQVAILLAMPSPPHAKTHIDVDQRASSDDPFQSELAIGLIEVPWTGEGLHVPGKNST
ncbi:hypothetical protein BC834DRAFT_969485 [Gloeopeniophorella convolvens]|nr:hypothetical protein BC834DRAFT_969485 [Gloeopeniophorella convolvens]